MLLLPWLLDAHADMRDRLHNAVLKQVPATRWREQADGGGSSIAALVLHLARHQDLALQTAIGGQAPRFVDHRAALGLGDADAGVALSEAEDRAVTAVIDVAPLRAYLDDVFAATQLWLGTVDATVLDELPDVGATLVSAGGIDPARFDWLMGMWSGRTVGWLVQWPILGHGHAHVGEAISIRNRMGLSPF